MTDLIEVSHLLKVEEMSGLQSKSRYIPKGFIPSSLNLFIIELVSFFIAPNTGAAPLAVGVLECLGLNLSIVEDSGKSYILVSTIGFSSIFILKVGISYITSSVSPCLFHKKYYGLKPYLNIWYFTISISRNL